MQALRARKAYDAPEPASKHRDGAQSESLHLQLDINGTRSNPCRSHCNGFVISRLYTCATCPIADSRRAERGPHDYTRAIALPLGYPSWHTRLPGGAIARVPQGL